MDLEKEIERMRKNPKNVSYNTFIRVTKELGFIHRQGKGSHEVMGKPGIERLVVIQRTKGKIKQYQVKQFLKLIENYNMVQGESKDE